MKYRVHFLSYFWLSSRSPTGFSNREGFALSLWRKNSPNIPSSWHVYNSVKFTWIMVDLKIQESPKYIYHKSRIYLKPNSKLAFFDLFVKTLIRLQNLQWVCIFQKVKCFKWKFLLNNRRNACYLAEIFILESSNIIFLTFATKVILCFFEKNNIIIAVILPKIFQIL